MLSKLYIQHCKQKTNTHHVHFDGQQPAMTQVKILKSQLDIQYAIQHDGKSDSGKNEV